MSRYWDGEAQPGGSFSDGGQIGNLDFLLSGQAVPRYDFNLSKEDSILGDFSPNDIVREERTREQTGYEYSMNLDYLINANSSARFNALSGLDDSKTEVDRWTTDLRIASNPVEVEREDNDSDRDNWEIGGDYEYSFSNGNCFKILFIVNESEDGQLRERFDVLASSEDKNLFLDTFSKNQERIVRSSYNMDLFEGQDIEVGIERAQTILNSNLRLAVNSSSGIPSADHGGLVPISVSNANSKVEEIRVEPYLVHNWNLNSRMILESTIKFEDSEIEQSGDVFNKRNFDFFKPKVDYRFNITPVLQFRGTVEKTVS